MSKVMTRHERSAEVLVTREELQMLEFEMASNIDRTRTKVHREHMDAFYVLEGELEVTLGDEPKRVPAGQIASVPPGTVHSFRNASGERVRFLNLHTPGMRFDEYIRRMDAGEKPNPADYDSFDPE